MNRIVDWLRRLRLGSRHRRVEMLGGHRGTEPSMIEPFKPDLGEAGREQRVRDHVRELGAESFDDATGNALTVFLTADGDDWSHRLDQQHRAWLARARQARQQAEGVAGQYLQLLNEDSKKLEHAERAVETAVLALSGYDSDDPDGRPSVRVISGHPVEPVGSAAPADERAARDGEHAARSAERDVRRGEGQDLERADGVAILRPPRLSRSGLEHLLDPQDARRVPQWGQRGFRDGALLGGRPRGTFIHVLALILAAGADVGAFAQTVQLVLQQADWVVLLVVIGLTAVVLYIAHMIGVMLREGTAASHRSSRLRRGPRGRAGRGVALTVCTLAWLALGVLAFWVRYTVPVPVSQQVGGCGTIGAGPSAGCSTSGGGNSHPLQAAAIFLGLYVATGIVAAVGAYFTHNPHRGGYVSALRAYRKASERTAASLHSYGRAQAAFVRQQAEIDESERILAQAQDQNKALTIRLKEVAKIEIAKLLKDPAILDAFFP